MPADIDEVRSSLAESFSLAHGGVVDRVQARLGGIGARRVRVMRRAVFATCVTWIPLLSLSLAEEVAYGTAVEVTFLRDFAVNARFLVALPILFLAEPRIDRWWRTLVLEFPRSGLINRAELGSFEAVIERITRLRDRLLPDAAILVAAFAPSFLVKTELLMTGASNWHLPGGELSLAGWWFNLVSTPLFRFLLLRWTWRMCLWTLFMWRVSRIRLHLAPAHTDLAAGLGFLSEGQRAFNPIVFAGGVVVAGQVVNAIAYEGATLSSVQFIMLAYALLAITFLIVPLLVVAPVLFKVKKQACLEFGALVTHHDQLFDDKWIRGQRSPDDVILGNADASSLADLGAAFTVVKQMKIVPIDKPTLISLTVAAGLPMVPVVLFATPAHELIGAVLKMLA
jgi:hypothetical protein